LRLAALRFAGFFAALRFGAAFFFGAALRFGAAFRAGRFAAFFFFIGIVSPPFVEMLVRVTKPVIQDAETAVRFAKELQLLLRYLGAGEANMEKGEMRVEANISVASPSDTANKKFGTKTEVKNLNSFRSVEKAIAYEIERQSSLLEQGGLQKLSPVRSTRLKCAIMKSEKIF
jgi:hypothetical protein